MESQGNQTSNEYFKTKVLTAAPEQLQLMLYDGAIRFCEQARPAILAGEIEKSFNLLTRAENILLEMCQGMRDELAPDTCRNMRDLYIFCYEQLVEANMKKDIAPLDDTLKILRHMRQTWVLLMEKLQQEKAGSITPADVARAAQSELRGASEPEKFADAEPGATISIEG